MRARGLSLLLALLPACPGRAPLDPSDAGADGAVFVALPRDFEGFTAWRRVDLGDVTLAGHPPGPRVGYVYVPGPLVDGRYPVGTRIVKAITVDGAGGRVEYFAMAKRGGGFNPTGAREWEFFLLSLDAQGHTVIVSRGLAPSDGNSDPYAGIGLGCNTCHGAGGSLASDSILSPALQPGADGG